ncbi:MAG: nucleoside 2-deoxyribosyltransferase domain-containing protein [Alphaproteobacteria bacterium]
MIETKAPDAYDAYLNKPSVFLAGSIEMGVAEDWQAKVSSALSVMDVLVLNPRRDNWDASWAQTIDNPPFREQVEWELAALDAADVILMYFDPATKSPITLLELGIHAAANPEKLIVCCPQGFWRKGNVDIVCNRYGVRQTETLDGLIKQTVQLLQAAN